MEAGGIYHLGLLASLLEKNARTWSFNPLLPPTDFDHTDGAAS